MQTLIEQNKNIVLRFNRECLEQGNLKVLDELVSDDFINYTARPGISKGKDGLIDMISNVLKPAFPDLKMEIYDQLAEGDKVTTRKAFHATHLGEFMGVKATGKKVVVDIIDIVTVKDGKYTEHWSIMNLYGLMAQLVP